MRKTASIMFLFFLVVSLTLSGCTTAITEERAAEITKTYLESGESQQVIDTFADIDSPVIESINKYGSDKICDPRQESIQAPRQVSGTT